ncbi:hypothetical protein D3C84_634250 [compost metagenome]
MSKIPVALADSDFSLAYRSLFCMNAVNAPLTCISANRSPVRKALSSDAIMALAFSGSVSLLILAVASAMAAAFFGSVAAMYF